MIFNEAVCSFGDDYSCVCVMTIHRSYKAYSSRCPWTVLLVRLEAGW